MAFSGLGGGGQPHTTPMAEINTTPLVDVMLVLLIIFMITAPLLAHKIKIDLPQASTVLLEEKPDTIVIALLPDGTMFLNDVASIATRLLRRLVVRGAAQAAAGAAPARGPDDAVPGACDDHGRRAERGHGEGRHRH